MADMIRSTTPLTNKNIVQPLRENKNADIAPFDVTDPNRIIKAAPDSGLLKQNTGNIDKQTAPEILMDLLKDPSVTVNFIKNITMLQEIIGVISMQNAPVTEEIEQLFNQLVVEPENLANELILQEQSSTAFKGELFDFLRGMVKESDEPALKQAVINVLKAVNTESNKSEVLKALSGTMKYLSETLKPNRNLSAKLADLSRQFRAPGAEKHFAQLKSDTAAVMQEMEKSIMFSSKLSSLSSMVVYNLSRYNTNSDFLGDAARNLMMFIPDEDQRMEFLNYLYDCLSGQIASGTAEASENGAYAGETPVNESGEFAESAFGNSDNSNMNAGTMGNSVSVNTGAGSAAKGAVNVPMNNTTNAQNSENSVPMNRNMANVQNGGNFVPMGNNTANVQNGENFVPMGDNTANVQNGGNFVPMGDNTANVQNGENFVPMGDNTANVQNGGNFVPMGNNTANVQNGGNFVPMDDNTANVQNGENFVPMDGNTANVQNGENFVPMDGNTANVQNGENFVPMDNNAANVQNGESFVPMGGNTANVQNGENFVPMDGNTANVQNGTNSVPMNNNSANIQNSTSSVPMGDNTANVQNSTSSVPMSGNTANVQNGENFVPTGNNAANVQNGRNSMPMNNNNMNNVARNRSDAPVNNTVNANNSENVGADNVSVDGNTAPAAENLNLEEQARISDDFPEEEAARLNNAGRNFENAPRNSSKLAAANVYNYAQPKTRGSKVLDVLVKILEKHTDNESVMQMKGESVENVIHSLLSSPSNFTPLLHFIIPVDDGESKAFGEMWINPDEEEKKRNSSGEIEIHHNIHMLLVFDIPDIGRFETELYVRDNKINLNLLCPEVMEDKSREISSEIRKCIDFSEYSFDKINIGRLEHSRSLVEVFPTLPQKRTGINVRI